MHDQEKSHRNYIARLVPQYRNAINLTKDSGEFKKEGRSLSLYWMENGGIIH